MKKFVSCFLSSIFIIVSFTACGDDNIDLTGTWEFFEADGKLVSSYVFTKDTYTLTYYTSKGTASESYGTYTVKDGKITLFFEDGNKNPLSVKLKGKTLTVGIAEYVKKK